MPYKRSLPLAGKLMGANQPKTFASGLLYGLSAASLFLAGELPRPRRPTDGISSDWQAVGKDFARAFDKYE
jgi:hypothetical protein